MTAEPLPPVEWTPAPAFCVHCRSVHQPPAPFDFMAPLPPLNIRAQRSWEPAARHYQDLTEAEKAENAKDENQ